jgi:hypothetical protein
VWAGNDGSPQNDTEIYLWDDGELLQLTDNDFSDFEPAISGRHVVWTGYADGDAEIYLATVPEPVAVPALSMAGAVALAAGLLASVARRASRRA